jgi:hypothetical protein
MTLTASQKVKFLILSRGNEWTGRATEEFGSMSGTHIDADFESFENEDEYWDAKSEVRQGEVETGLKCEWSRHYESKAVAAQLPDGSWVGWTYWYGGGKHAEPESIDWVEDAYDLTCTEEEKVVTVRTFAEVPA